METGEPVSSLERARGGVDTGVELGEGDRADGYSASDEPVTTGLSPAVDASARGSRVRTERRPRFVHPHDRWQPSTAMSTSGAAQVPNASQASPQELNRLRLRAVEVRSALMAGLRTISAQETARTGTPAQAAVIDHTAVQNQLNAMTIIDFFGVVEGYVEALCKALRQPVVEHQSQEYERLRIRTRQIISQHSSAAYARGTPISDGTRRAMEDVTRAVIKEFCPDSPVESLGKGMLAVDRWEDALRRVGFGAGSRPLPRDLRNTLNELGEIRNVLLHRMGRIDQKALDAVDEGPWEGIGEEVIIDRHLYRRYVAALWSFSEELVDRLSTRISGDQPRFVIDSWRDNVPAGG